MSAEKNLGHAAQHLSHLGHEMEKPLKAKKNALLAAVLGFFFGAIGLAIYLRSLKDFFIPLALFLILTAFLNCPGIFMACLFSAGYGAIRVIMSNEAIDARNVHEKA